jgi:tetratricopeptide (TPR) repeat protein
VKRIVSVGNSNRVDELANALARQGKAADIESEVDKLDRAGFSDSELESWYHIRGIAAFRRGDRPLAMSRFIEAHAAFPNSAMIAFSLGQEYEYVGDVESMFALFDGALFPKLPALHALAQSRYAYLWGDIQRAISYVEPILEVHFQLGNADDTFLWIRRMPFFSQTWAYMAAFAELSSDLTPLEAMTQRAAAELKDSDVSHLTEFLSCMQKKDFSTYEANLNYGTGYERTRAAVIHALRQTEYSKAKDVLDSVKIADNDFPWLNDILLLAHCEAAHRFDSKAEAELQEQFLLRQPLLFEPDHAVNFRLLEYQESLKRIYQARRSATNQ